MMTMMGGRPQVDSHLLLLCDDSPLFTVILRPPKDLAVVSFEERCANIG
jgi:hypothetical protein